MIAAVLLVGDKMGELQRESGRVRSSSDVVSSERLALPAVVQE